MERGASLPAALAPGLATAPGPVGGALCETGSGAAERHGRRPQWLVWAAEGDHHRPVGEECRARPCRLVPVL